MALEPDIKQEWADRVETEVDQKTYGALRDDDAFCVLGVLCDIHPDLQWQFQSPPSHAIKTWKAVDKASGTDGPASESASSLPESFMHRYGLTLGQIVKFSDANDGGQDWPVIADMIRRSRL